jgi:hypothetical protein
MWTKLDVIRQAFSEIGKGAYEFDLQPEDLQNALRKLDAMMAAWGGAGGVRIGYAGGDGKGLGATVGFVSVTTKTVEEGAPGFASDLGTDTTVPDWAYEALYLNLALRLCPDYGKTPSPLTVTHARNALEAVRSRTTPVATRRIGGYAGAGNTAWGAMHLPDGLEPVETGPDNTLTFGVGE